MRFYVESVNEPQPTEWFIYMETIGADGELLEWEYCRTYDYEIDAYRVRKCLIKGLELVNLDDWIPNTMSQAQN